MEESRVLNDSAFFCECLSFYLRRINPSKKVSLLSIRSYEWLIGKDK
jgi:hypothetical protein